jgi:hypothetical protein
VKVLELQLSGRPLRNCRAAERLCVSSEQLSILSIEEKLAQIEEEFRRSAEYVIRRTPNSIDDFRDTVCIK